MAAAPAPAATGAKPQAGPAAKASPQAQAKPKAQATPKAAVTPKAAATPKASAKPQAAATPRVQQKMPTATASQPTSSMPHVQPSPAKPQRQTQSKARSHDPRSLPKLRPGKTVSDHDLKHTGGVTASATPRPVAKATPKPKATATPKTDTDMSMAKPSLRGSQAGAQRPKLTPPPAKPSQQSEAAETDFSGAPLRPDTQKILQAWAEGSTVAPVPPRKEQPGRGAGARSRSIPTPRGPGSGE